MARDPEQIAHLEWLGYVQPVGLVVSIPALLAAQAHVNRNIAPGHARFLASLPRDRNDEIIPEIRDFGEFTRHVLGWEAADLIRISAGASLPEQFASLEVVLPEYQETLRPDCAVREFESKEDKQPWLMLIQEVPGGTDFDKPLAATDRNWHASPQAKFERLLRETTVPIGLLFSSTHLRLIYAPRGETSGYMTFSVAEMAQVAGRPIFAGLVMLLSAERLFSLPEKQRLPAILSESRKYQNTVSTQLAQQVLAALYELLRGFQAADDHRHGELLGEVLADDPNHVYAGLLTVLMRLVFVLYAEDRDLMPGDPVYANFYSVTGLFERLRADQSRFPDTMDLRYGAWAQLLTLFRLVYKGGGHGGLRIRAREGYLFDPDRYPFLEGRSQKSRYSDGEKPQIPHVADGVLYRVLEKLLILDGERLSYRTLDVEQIGSVYEAIMGFNLEVAQGRSIAVKPAKPHGAPATVNLEALLAVAARDRVKWLKDHTDQKLTGQAAESLKNAKSVGDLLAALARKIDRNVTPNDVQAGAMVFQPSDERRRSGSHYTPRSLTEPIVRTTLRPILEQLGPKPTPEQILDLNVCDPAMGSGAFLVQACRQLGDELVKAWHHHDCAPSLPPDEDELLHARRLIAQQCVYGVDKNPMAVDLAKLSLWLATLAKEHPFTFLDHTLRCGDSLVGLSRDQIAAFHWRPPAKRSKDDVWFGDPIAERMRTVTEYRKRILAARDDKPYEQLRQELDVADEALSLARLAGDSVIATYFSAGTDRERIAKLDALARQLVKYIGPQSRIEDRQPLTDAVTSLHSGEHSIQPLHWQIEFPEVFTFDAKGKPTGGFDAFVGNPPFMGGMIISAAISDQFKDWLYQAFPGSGNRMDLVAYFFRRAYELLRDGGTFGLIATNTIAQGDTRFGGLRVIRHDGGVIYSAERRLRWPGQAAVIVSVVHVRKRADVSPKQLDSKAVAQISAYLFHQGGDDDPSVLSANRGFCSIGSNILGMGFTFDDAGNQDVASPCAEMRRLIAQDSRNQQVIFPFIGGEEVNSSPVHAAHRYVINFGDMTEEQARSWPELFAIVENHVRPARMQSNREAYRDKWWQFAERQPTLYESIRSIHHVLANSQVSPHLAFAFVPGDLVYAHTLNVFAFEDFFAFCVLQSRPHEVWARFLASSMKDDMRYTPTDCFATFPFPTGVLEHAANDSPTTDIRQLTALETAGREYYKFRAALMVRNNEGLTKTYNRFHDPNETSSDILKLRELHAAMDQAVLEAYGWADPNATCDFLLDYEEDEDDEDGTSRQRKPWRYRWPDQCRDEVLTRLLALNQERAEQERLAGLDGKAATTSSGKGHGKKAQTSSSKRKRNSSKDDHPTLPGM